MQEVYFYTVYAVFVFSKRTCCTSNVTICISKWEVVFVLSYNIWLNGCSRILQVHGWAGASRLEDTKVNQTPTTVACP